jgi:hypothetical protein
MNLILRFFLVITLAGSCVFPAGAQISAQPSDTLPHTLSDLWLETSFAMAGSLAGNSAAVLVFFLADVLPPAFSDAADNNWIEAGGIWWLGLLALPALTTPLALHLFYPLPQGVEADWRQSVMGSVGSVLLHTLCMLPVFMLVQQPEFSQSIYLTLPLAFFSAVVLEGLGTAWLYDQSRHLSLKQTGAGLQVVYQLNF